jgi:signal transduction histidine kinase
VSHELRTPLTSIKGWAITLQSESFQQKEMLSDGLNIIAKESDRLTQMVEELLDFSKFVSGRIKLNPEDVNLINLFEHLHKQLTPRAVRDNIDFVVDYPEDMPNIYADVNRLKQLFINLLDNAFNFNQPGGYIHFKAEIQEEDFKFTISDNGCGIGTDELPMVKEKFFKGKSSPSKNGIGLSICEEIVNLMGGRLEIMSELKKGTDVVIILPKGEKVDA